MVKNPFSTRHAPELAPDEHPDEPVAAGKGRPTPTRREREAARKRPLVPNDRKEAARTNRAKQSAVRERARIGMASGEEKYLPARDRGPQRRYVRDYVDARFNVGEFMIPVMLIVIIISLIPSRVIQAYGMLALWAFFIIMVVDSVILGFLIVRRLGDKFGKPNVKSGSRWYAAMRAIQLRMIRLPKPQVKRGQYPA